MVRVDIKLTRAKIADCVGHAALACYKEALKTRSAIVNEWEEKGCQAKIVLQVNSEAELLKIIEAAKIKGIPTSVIEETEKKVKTAIVGAIGPDTKKEIDLYTGLLKLLT